MQYWNKELQLMTIATRHFRNQARRTWIGEKSKYYALFLF